MHQASLIGCLDLVKLLVECGAQIDPKDSNGFTPLHYALQNNRLEIVALFIQYGINLNEPSYKNETPLHTSVQYYMSNITLSDQIIILLLSNGAYFSLASQNSSGYTPFELACELGKAKLVDLFVKFCLSGDKLELVKKFSNKCLLIAAKNGHDEIIRIILIYDLVDLNFSTKEGSALHEACRAGRLQTVKLLLECGIDINLKNSNSQSAFDVVIKQKIGNDIKCLIREFSQSVRAVSLAPNNSTHTGALNFNANEVITVLDKSNQNWRGFILDKSNYTTRSGYFPSEYVQLIDNGLFHSKKTFITSSTNSLLKLNDSDSIAEHSIYLSNSNLDRISKLQKINISPSSSSLSSSSSSSYTNRKKFNETLEGNIEIDLKSPNGIKNVSDMLKMGMTDSQIIFNWLKEFQMECYYENFVKSGYDLITITKCCPADLCAIGISDPGHRERIKKAINQLDISEIEAKLDEYLANISSLEELLRLIHLDSYLSSLNQLYKSFSDFLHTVSWEDLEDLGIKKLGHQKKLIFICKKIKKLQIRNPGHQKPPLPLTQFNNLTKSLENLDIKNNLRSDRAKKQPPLPPRVSSIVVPKEPISTYATLPRSFGKKNDEQSSSSSSSISPNSLSPKNKYFDVASILVPPTPPPMPLISIPLDESIRQKSPRRCLNFNPKLEGTFNKINSNFKLSSVFNKSNNINSVNMLSNNSQVLPSRTDEGILNDIDSMLCDLNKQLDNMLDFDNSFST